MSNKQELKEANAALRAAMNRVQEIADQHPSLMIIDSNQFTISFASIAELGTRRVDFICGQLTKLETKMPKGPKKVTEHLKESIDLAIAELKKIKTKAASSDEVRFVIDSIDNAITRLNKKR